MIVIISILGAAMESAFECLALMTPMKFTLVGVSVDNILLIGFGGFLGSLLRYVFSGYVQRILQSAEFPYGTIAVNIAGCLMIGFLSQLVESRGAFASEIRAFLFIGFLGGFTTFSTFGNETMNLFRDRENMLALANVVVQVLCGLGAVWLGRTLAYLIWR
jgi:CrcB protein